MRKNIFNLFTPIVISLVFMLFCPAKVFAHCDTMDGPVVKAAQSALESDDVNLVLIWVQKKDEAEVKKAFNSTRIVRELNPEAKELADKYFFETVVRLHRANEGAPYAGLKPGGSTSSPAIGAADKAIETGLTEPLVRLLTNTMKNGVLRHFKRVVTKKNYKPDDIEAGREYVKVYVDFMHYVEHVYEAATRSKNENIYDLEEGLLH